MDKSSIVTIIAEFSDELLKDSSNFLFDNIPSSKYKNAKESHKLEIYDEILFLRDYTFFGSATESFIITLKGLSIVIDDTKDPYKISWDEIEGVDFVDDDYIFFFDNSKNELKKINRKEISHNIDELNHIGKSISKLFTRVSQEFENKEKLAYEAILELKATNNLKAVIEKTEEFLNEYQDNLRYFKKIQFLRAESFYLVSDFEKALALINNVLEKDPLRYYFLVLKGKILFLKNDYFNALITYQVAFNLKSDGLEKDNLKQGMDDIYSKLISNFFNEDYSKRKTILINNGLNFSSTSFLPLDKNKLPSGIYFPIGHPIENELYIGHPLKSTIYLPIENYEYDLFLDRINEFCYLLQCLGATELTIKTVKGQTTDQMNSEQLQINSKINAQQYGKFDTEVETNNLKESSTDFNQKLEKTQRFSPTKKPFIPKELTWYENEPAWQRLFQQRVNGNILEYHENIATNQKKLFSDNEITKIKADYEHLLASVNVNIASNSNAKFDEQENTEWEISVKFESIENLNGEVESDFQIKDTTSKISTPFLKNEESEFILMCEDIFNDGVFSEDEKSLLERKRIKLAITEERGEELMLMVQSKKQMSTQELEYLEEFNFCLKSNGIISEDERRLLNRLKINLNITDDRALELEKIVSNKFLSNS